VARGDSGQITHVRNLDFSYTEVMKTLIYTANLVKDGEIRAQSPCIAGYYGSYTGHKKNQFSVSYNVRETVDFPTVDMIRPNLERTLDPSYIPMENLIQELLLEEDVSFYEAVATLMTA
jgi:hypothetical protein